MIKAIKKLIRKLIKNITESEMRVRPCVIIIKDNRVLLLKYNYNGTVVYGIPGGNPKKNETLENCLIRELKEELSIEINLIKLILVGEVIFEKKNDTTLHCVFWGSIVSGIPQINPIHTTSLGYEWIKLTGVDSINMYPNVGGYMKNFTTEINNNIYIGKIDQKWF